MAKNGPYYEKRTFERGVDMDSALSGVEQGFSRYMLNCLIDNGVEVTNIKGNLVANYDPAFTYFKLHPTYGYRCIGSIYEPIFQKIYFFVVSKDLSPTPIYSSFIFEYDIAANLVSVVCDENWSDILLFEWDELITSVSITFVDTIYPLLYWSQNAGLRKINIFKAKNIFNPGGYQDRTVEIVDRIKYPPMTAPIVDVQTDSTKNFNKINNRFFQFSYRYIFDDYERSVPSIYSKVDMPLFMYYPPAAVYSLNSPYFYNKFNININTGSEIVKKIQLLFRAKTSDVGTEVNGDWYIYDTLDKSILGYSDNVNIDYAFYNDKVPIILTQEEATRLYDNVPLKAKADGLGEDQRMYDGNVTEGFNLEPIDIDSEFGSREIYASTDVIDNLIGFGTQSFTGGFSTFYIELPAVIGTISVGNIVRIIGIYKFNTTPAPFAFSYEIQPGDLSSYPLSLKTAIITAFNTYNPYSDLQIISGDTDFIAVITDDPLEYSSPGGGGYVTGVSILSGSFKGTFPTFKSGDVHRLGIYYSDAGGRQSSVQAFETNLPFPTENNPSLGNFYQNYLSLSVNHVPPIWAKYWNVVYAGTKNVGNFYQLLTPNITVVNGNLTCKANFFSAVYTFKNQTFLNYSFSPGDVIRFIGKPSTSNNGTVTWFGKYTELPIYSFDETTGVITFQSSAEVFSNLSIYENGLAEIYTPKVQSGFYYDIARFGIGDAGTDTRYHEGNVQNQAYSPSAIPAIVSVEGVDCYLRRRDFTAEILLIEDRNQWDFPVGSLVQMKANVPTEYNQSAVTSLGRPNKVNDNFRQVQREDTIWFSGQFIQESGVNGLSSYPDGQFRDYAQNYGGIQRFISTDRALKIFFELRCGWIPIAQEVSAVGVPQSFVLTSDKILTDIIYYVEKRGIGKHPESVVERAGVVYGVDPISGCIFRISRDGFTIISDVKNAQGNYLVRQSIFNAIKSNPGNFVAGFNERRNSYEVNLGGVVMVWDEQKNSWVGGRSYNAEYFSNAGIDLVSFYNGKLYLHEANSLVCNFYGVQYKPKLWVVGNWQSFNKVYKALWMKSKTPWNAYDILNTVGQKSIIDKVRFSKRENIWQAAFRRDMNTVNIKNPIVDGNEMRDIAILLKLENDSLQYDFVNYIILNQIESK